LKIKYKNRGKKKEKKIQRILKCQGKNIFKNMGKKIKEKKK
jgi:hypothetical protein